jgi:aminoglycoside phosphotransferase (APT) family kinase protein
VTLSNELRSWIEGDLGGRIVSVEQQVRWRPHYFLEVDVGGEVLSVLARCGRRPEEVAASGLLRKRDISHEARVLEALQGCGLKIPKFYGFSEAHRVILMSRLPGTNTLAEAPDDQTRRTIMFEYYDQLARLHSLDIGAMSLEGIEVPTTAEEVAFKGKFGLTEESYLAGHDTYGPQPLLDLAIWWLHANVPEDSRVSFLQGDTGPGQFMFADGHLTGLIDWELAHIGNPMLDLGVARMRNMLYPTGSLKEPIAHYEKVSGNTVDWTALSFYTVMSMVLTPLGMARVLRWPDARSELTMPGFGWDVTLRRGLCDALSEAVGIEITPPELPTWESGRPETMADFLVGQLDIHCLPLASDAAGRHRLETALGVARTLQLESHIGHQLLADDLDDMAVALGKRPDNRTEGLTALSGLVVDAPEEHMHSLINVFSRMERRREHLWRPLMTAQDSIAFEALRPRNATN